MSKSKKQKYYVVWKGRRTGIFSNWDDCSAQVSGFPGAEYKAFESREAAEQAFRGKYEEYKGKDTAMPDPKKLLEVGPPITPSYTVDASCIGNPGLLEYRCVDTETKRIIFAQGPFENGTNNIGEFLGIVDALAMCKDMKITLPIYSDSRNALIWVREKKCKTNLQPDAKNAPIFELIERAEQWLEQNSYANKVLKWETDAWGENPADYGRK